MTAALSILIQADGKAAEAALRELGTSAEKAGLSVRNLGKKGAATDAEIAALNSELAKASAQVEVLTKSEARAVAQMSALQAQSDRVNARMIGIGQSTPLAAGSVANLTANFNDLAVMMAAGQNPLQLALQQGTQITQVIGPMGAAGAVRALGTAFLSLLSPVNIVTLGVIAGGAALAQWAFHSEDAEEKTLTFAEKVDEAAAAISRAGSAAQLASLGGLEDLRAKYGEISDEVLGLATRLYDIEKRAAVAKVEVVLDEATGPAFEAEIEKIAGAVGAALAGAGSQANAEQIAEAERLIRGIETEIAMARLSNRSTRDLEQKVAEQREYIAALKGDFAAIGDLASDLSIPPEFAAEIAQIRNALRGAIEAGDITGVADQLARMQSALEASGATIDQEVLDGLTNAEDVAREMAARLNEGETNAAGIANTNMASSIAAARSEATRLADELRRAYDASVSLAAQGAVDLQEARIRLDTAGNPVEEARQLGVLRMQQAQGVRRQDADAPEIAALDAEAIAYGNVMAKKAQLDAQRSEALKSARGSGSAKAARQERDAIADLIAQQQLQIDLLQETDPVQKEMIRNRETLAAATDSERAAVEGLIRQRQQEETRLASLTEQQDIYASAAYSAIDGLILRGKELGDVFENVADMIASAVLQAALMGEGAFAGALGTSTGGGLLGMAVSGITGSLTESAGTAIAGALPAAATGGYIHGPGSGTSDDVLMWGSSGEFMMNAQATQRYRHILEAMNAGGLPAFARGGALSQTASADQTGTLGLSLVVNDYSGRGVETEQGTDSLGRPQLTMTVGRQVASAVSQRGNPLRKAMSQEFALRPAGRNRG
ncbi:phage tail length tape measure family protein [Chachezhania antarctica]|uniref:phage tail length tape measure family protein n=1 Tax=Chachezhania antarctica TaxID=2340860 RepID=UPI000EB3C842|nr:phage tail length tape measure family protein [Chachezhania antarctica]|tara:strand:- start:14475 stop:16988 length:2514 start_codon:yes stop_codon:yes gene_type:complete